MAVYQGILLAVDLNPDSKLVGQRALALTEVLNAELWITHVVEPLPAMKTSSCTGRRATFSPCPCRKNGNRSRRRNSARDDPCKSRRSSHAGKERMPCNACSTLISGCGTRR